MYKTYIYATVAQVLAENIPEQQPLNSPLEPMVASDDDMLFADDVLRKVESYKDKAVLVEDFESWMALLEIIATDLQLSPATDFPKVAAVLNRYRIANGKEPL